MTEFTIHPMKGTALSIGAEFEVVDKFPAHARIVALRRPGLQSDQAFVQGDGAVLLLRDGVKRLRVIEVEPMGGWGTAVEVGECGPDSR